MTLKVVMLSDIQLSIPKRSRRQSLMKDDRILEVAFRRCIMSNEVMEYISFKDLGNVSNFSICVHIRIIRYKWLRINNWKV